MVDPSTLDDNLNQPLGPGQNYVDPFVEQERVRIRTELFGEESEAQPLVESKLEGDATEVIVID